MEKIKTTAGGKIGSPVPLRKEQRVGCGSASGYPVMAANGDGPGGNL